MSTPPGSAFPDKFKWYDEGGVPVIFPTMDEFRDFKQFISEIEPFGMSRGIVKVVPPKEWVESLPELDEQVKDIRIKNPIMQNVHGSGGLFKLQNIEKQRTYNIAEWRMTCDEPEHQPPAPRGQRRKAGTNSSSNNSKRKLKRTKENAAQSLEGFDYRFDGKEFTDERCEELEKAYWKSLTYSSPMYGADMPGSLFGEEATVWNVAHLDNILNRLRVQIPGVNTAYLYCGMWKATFAWHLEDMDLFSINYIHFGAPKQWYSISQEDHVRFFNIMKDMWPEEYKKCKEFVRHKTFHASPALLQQKGIKVNKIVHRQHEFMITFPYGYHSGFNYGYNVAESVNFAMESWLPIGKISNKCRCISDSVGIDVDQLIRHMKGEYTEDEESESIAEDEEPAVQLPTPPYAPSETRVRKKRKRKMAATSTPEKEAGSKKPRKLSGECVLCPDLYNNDFIQDQSGKKIHRLCALYIPETSIVNGEVFGVEDIPKARRDLRCIECGSGRGACFQCSYPTCSRAYHATCADSAGVLVTCEDGELRFRCRFHRPKRPAMEKLEFDRFTLNWASTLLPGDVAQCQVGDGEIFAGVVEENRFGEESVLIRALPSGTELIEVAWKWVRHPGRMIGSNSAVYGIQQKVVVQHAQGKENLDRVPEQPVVHTKRPGKSNHYKGEKILFTSFQEDVNNSFNEELGYGWVTQGLKNLEHEPYYWQSGVYGFHLYKPLESTMIADVYIYL